MLGFDADTTRTTYRLAGQIIAVQTKVGTAAGTFCYTYTDHLGNVMALSWTGGTFVPNSKARYTPSRNFRTSRRQLSIPASATAASPATG